MTEQAKPEQKPKGFFQRIVSKVDAKMKEKADSKPCCCQKDKNGKCS